MKKTAFTTESIASFALVFLAIFPVIVIALNFIQHAHYDAVKQAISELALGRDGWLMAIAFPALGAGILLVAILVRRTVAKALTAPPLLTVAALLAGPVSAIFHTDPTGAKTTMHGQIHTLAGISAFIIVVVAMFITSRSFFRDPVWRRLAVPTLVWAFCGLGTFFLVPILGNSEFGVAQRIFVATWLSWLLTVAACARRLPAPAGHEKPARLTPPAQVN